MLLKRNQIIGLLNAIEKIRQDENFSITTKYKLLKIKNVLLPECELNIQLIQELNEKYGEVNEEGECLIKQEFLEQVSKELDEFNEQTVSISDIFFSLDELEDKNLSWDDLEALMPFIK